MLIVVDCFELCSFLRNNYSPTYILTNLHLFFYSVIHETFSVANIKKLIMWLISTFII